MSEMERDQGPVLLFSIVLFMSGVVLLVTSSDMCNVKMVSDAVRNAQTLSCLEFWTNRYQGLIGAVMTILAAGVAWVSVQVQLRENRFAKKRADGILTNRMFLEFSMFKGVWAAVSFTNVKGIHVGGRDNKITLEWGIEYTDMKLKECRKYYDDYIATWRQYDADDILKMRLMATNGFVYRYLEAVAGTLSALRVAADMLKADELGNMDEPNKKNYATVADSWINNLNNEWKVADRSVAEGFAHMAEACADKNSHITADELNKITADAQRLMSKENIAN